MNELDSITSKLASTCVEEDNEVSFAGKGLKLDTEKDAEEIVQAIKNCPGMTSLRLEGNTVGIPAAKAIAKALEGQPKFKRALWKDMFTRRTEHEIPDALNFLSSGIMLAKAQLIELDLSDNAFGPRGLKGIVNLLKSEPCYTLEKLYLNNNGLGITGGKMLAGALSQCLINSRDKGNPLNLKVFVCGRNRLENEGAIALSKFLKDIGTLESIAMPQNGIYHKGIKGLSEAFAANTNLRTLNLEDNSLTEAGAEAIAKHLPTLKNLEAINFGDCLIRTKGAIIISNALKNNCPHLKEIILGYNEINIEGGKAIVEAMEDKVHLENLVLNGNQFGAEGCELVKGIMEAMGKKSQLGSLDEDEDLDDEDEDEVDYNEDDNEAQVEDEESDGVEEEEEDQVEEEEHVSILHKSPMLKAVTLEDFVNDPSSAKLLSLQQSNIDLLSGIGENQSPDKYFDMFLKVSSVVTPGEEKTKLAAIQCTDALLSAAFNVHQTDMRTFNNAFLVSLGLIKAEDKKPKVGMDLTGVFIVLQHAVQQKYFHNSTKDLLQFFLSRQVTADACPKTKHALMQILYQV